ncbi:hypothetical protein IGI04_012004 [Brassica rapa subsp. trilocularis]|uniref:Uncharacterized protein n=1 Tax=Brassica rapa subsp. trilocularis TaxID=1813537 RepID=A0ABQ7N4S4_BRACM|nr:hypothetical protein IGI04_012004 [Brassica rapa subsp. trilocularis]
MELGQGSEEGGEQAHIQTMIPTQPHAMEEVQSEDAAPQIETETQGMELGQGIEGGGEQAQIQTLILTQPHAMEEAVQQKQPRHSRGVCGYECSSNIWVLDRL